MLKIISICVLLCFAMFDVQARYVIDTNACAGAEWIQDTDGEWVLYEPDVHVVTEETPVFYANTINVPHFVINAGRKTKMYFYNQSGRDVQFFYTSTYYNAGSGDEVSASHEIYKSTFSGQSPHSPSGALLKANSVGMIEIPYTNTDRYGHAKIKWTSDTCGEAPILGSMELMWYQQYSGGRGSLDHFFLNSGKAF